MTSEWKKVEITPAWNRVDKNKKFVLKAGDMLEGIFVGVERNIGANNSNLYSLRNENGETVSVWGSTILDSRLKNLQLGEEVKIVYLGSEQSQKSGRNYHNYDVFHRQPENKKEEAPEPEEN